MSDRVPKGVSNIMKNYGFLVFLLLCALASTDTDTDQLERMAKSINISKEALQSCLGEGNVDLELFLELCDLVNVGYNATFPQETVEKFGKVNKCIFERLGVFRDSKILVKKFADYITSTIKADEQYSFKLLSMMQLCESQVDDKKVDYEKVFYFATCVSSEVKRTFRAHED